MSRLPPIAPEELKRRVEIIVDQCEGIAPQFEAFYINSIMHAAQASAGAFERFASAFVRNEDDRTIVAHVQEALTYAAALSRFFWPSDSSALARARGAKLRTAFAVEESLLQDRRLRKALEHFGERLDVFLLRDPVGVILPEAMVGPSDLADDEVGHVFRLVDPIDLVFVLFGERYAFGPIWDEVRKLVDRANAFDKRGSRLPRVDGN